MSALTAWAHQNDFNITIATQEWLLNQGSPSDLSKFDEKTAIKIRKLYETSKKN